MQEIFYEESARTQDEKGAKVKYNIFRILSYVSYFLLFVWGVISLYCFPLTGNLTTVLINLLFFLLPIAMFLASGIILGKIKNKFYVDYDYTFVTGSVRISKVIANVKRRHIISFESSQIETIGKYDSETFNKYNSMPNISKQIFTSNVSPDKDKDFYYIVVNSSSKYLFVLECTETFIVQILKFAGRSVLEKDFK